MKLYELVGKDKNRGFSPYVWRIRMALAHKGLEAELIPLIFTEISQLEDTDARTVPILEHEGKFITDSWDIACYLEENFPDRPSLFGGKAAQALARTFDHMTLYNLIFPLFPALVNGVFEVIDEKDRDYFRSTREKKLGKSLEEAAEHQQEALVNFQKQLWPYDLALKSQPFFSGDQPAYTDYILYGIFQWARGVSPLKLLEEGQPLYDWRSRMDDLFDGLGRKFITGNLL